MTTCEDRVGLGLYKFLAENRKVTLISYHPPDGKAYATDLIRIPKKGKTADSATRDRYHVDIIYTVSNYLVLVELKCSLSESEHDIAKLREIRDTYSLQELISIIARRLTTASPKILENIDQLVLALGFENLSPTIVIPPEFICFNVVSEIVSIRYGDGLPLAVKYQFS